MVEDDRGERAQSYAGYQNDGACVGREDGFGVKFGEDVGTMLAVGENVLPVSQLTGTPPLMQVSHERPM